ncbi:MAG: methyltransferase domain-containing protein [Bacteroidetes bacterium]|nr:methyltransferase domain-containing protein [Bacteroidota bacterium]
MKLFPLLKKIHSRFSPLYIHGLSEIRSFCAGKKGLEIGGPSHLFTWKGKIPLYSAVGSLDACSFSSSTMWEGKISEGKNFFFHPKKEPGYQFIGEAGNLLQISDNTYDFLLASHVLEHCANPIRVLKEWMRVTKENGMLLLVVPHKDGTFDHNRTITPFQHLLDDERKETTERDETHTEEFIERIDLSMTAYKDNRPLFEERTRNNFIYRGMHHHVFNTALVVQLVDYVGLNIINVQTMRPFHIVVTAQKRSPADNKKFLAEHALYKQRSPFHSDKQ